MDYVCDTNVWYDIGSGRIDPAKLKAGGNRLIAPALNAIEISTNLDDCTLQTRQRASQAILDHADEHLDDPERYMGAIWGLDIAPLPFPWKDVCRVIVSAKDISEIENGGQKIMKINTIAAKAWRSQFTDQFANDVEVVLRGFVSDYGLRRRSGVMDYYRGEEAKAIKMGLAFPVVAEKLVLLTQRRVSELLKILPAPPTEDEIREATVKLTPFVKAYLKFVEVTATEKAVVPNDWGDLHCFVYLQGDRKILTGEKKWLSIASEAGMDNLVQDSKIFL